MGHAVWQDRAVAAELDMLRSESREFVQPDDSSTMRPLDDLMSFGDETGIDWDVLRFRHCCEICRRARSRALQSCEELAGSAGSYEITGRRAQ